MITPTLLDDPEFHKGFALGIEAYLNEAEDENGGYPLTKRRVDEEIQWNLNPKIRQNGHVLCVISGCPPLAPTYEVGYLAGWMAAHTSKVYELDSPQHS